ncbi:MAG: hypothetical protein AMJ94_06605 [Deltaproteobacteria bacterium SM23_61]|nr:MAG: hypothetical protein AMJ94_06605 [Deltaproteobacteria bacterium SM23_61]
MIFLAISPSKPLPSLRGPELRPQPFIFLSNSLLFDKFFSSLLSLCLLRDLCGERKKTTAEYAETAELFLGKDKKHKSFYGRYSSLPFEPPGLKTKG